jgi:hypothetical protein
MLRARPYLEGAQSGRLTLLTCAQTSAAAPAVRDPPGRFWPEASQLLPDDTAESHYRPARYPVLDAGTQMAQTFSTSFAFDLFSMVTRQPALVLAGYESMVLSDPEP